MKILFICKHNRFRSRIANSYFRKINKDKKIKVDSCGLIKGIAVSKNVISVAKRYGINIEGKTKGLDEKSLLSRDIFIIVADDVPKSILKRFNKKIIIWKIEDASQSDKKAVEKVIKKIMNKVEKLIKDLMKNGNCKRI